MRHALLGSILFAAAAASAQNLQNLDGVASRATMIVSDGEYKSCGMRFVGLAVDAASPSFPAYGWDFNLTIGHFGPMQLVAILKTEMSLVQSAAAVRNPKLVKLAETWLQIEGGPNAKPHKTGIAGDNGLSTMTGYPIDPWEEELRSIAVGKPRPLLLGMRLASEKATRIYRFTPSLEDGDAKAYLNCMATMLRQLGEKLEKK